MQAKVWMGTCHTNRAPRAGASRKQVVVPPKYIEYGIYGNPIVIYPKPYSICLRGAQVFRHSLALPQSVILTLAVNGCMGNIQYSDRAVALSWRRQAQVLLEDLHKS